MESNIDRKSDHITLTQKSQTFTHLNDKRFYYEPMLAKLSGNNEFLDKFRASKFLNSSMQYPIWISSMTGGTGVARHINQNLASVCREFGLGMGLGSCRQLLSDNTYFDDFNLRPIIGNTLPLWVNLGIAQVYELLKNNEHGKILDLVSRLEASGLIVHVNPLQEWFQPEGDIIYESPIETITKLISKIDLPIIVKEVGQGMGPASLLSLMKLPIYAIEFAAFGGTNFSTLEKARNSSDLSIHEGMTYVGHTALEMVELTNKIIDDVGNSILCKNFIISGGVRSYLDGYYLMSLSKGNCVFGMASPFLEHANSGIEELKNYTQQLITGIDLASRYLRVKV